MKIYNIIFFTVFIGVFVACKNNDNTAKEGAVYTCPMPQDSVFSDQPGKCPKCGMQLVKIEKTTEQHEGYTCPMHPNIHSQTAGNCPICGMQLEKMKPPNEPKSVSLNTLLKPSNQQVIANIQMVHMQSRIENLEMDVYGFITYDTRQVGVISSNYSGRIEKLYIKYRYQKIDKGQKIMDIYSPELLTAQDNLLFLLDNDPENYTLIEAAKQKLYLLGMSKAQLDKVIKSKKTAYTVSVYSNYSGHIHESSSSQMGNSTPEAMQSITSTTKELNIKEGMYIQKGQNIFSIYNPDKAWVLLNIFTGQAALIKVGNKVIITPETNPNQKINAKISYIEPFYRPENKTLTARVYFDNSNSKIPIGSQVKATIFAGNRSANWLPEEAIISLGLDKIVFVRTGEAFLARKIETGITNRHLVQILSGLDENEAVAVNAQYLVDSESFIKTNE